MLNLPQGEPLLAAMWEPVWGWHGRDEELETGWENALLQARLALLKMPESIYRREVWGMVRLAALIVDGSVAPQAMLRDWVLDVLAQRPMELRPILSTTAWSDLGGLKTP